MSKPVIVKPNLKFTSTLLPFRQKVVKLVQHHMAHRTWNINDVHNYHKNTNGWAGIGYNFWIGFDGIIYEARGLFQGVHCRGHNSNTIGIGYQGHFGQQQMTDAQLKSGIELNKWLMDMYNLTSADIVGHRDLVATACPDRNFRMIELRDGVQKYNVKGDDDTLQLVDWQWNDLEQAIHKLNLNNTEQWLDKIKKRELTISELTWLNTIVISRNVV